MSKKDITIRFLGTCSERALPRESPAACAQCIEAVKDSKHAFQSSLLVNNKFMLDAGWNFSKVLNEIGAKYILLTHAHSDHVGAIVSEDRKVKAEIHGPKGIRSDITELYGTIGHQITEHVPGESFTLDGVKFKFVPVYHSSKVVTYAIKVDKRIMYAPDFLGFTKGFELEGIELFIGDGSCLDRSIKRKSNVGHMSMVKQVEMCSEAKVQHVIFTHVGHLYTRYDDSLLTLRKLSKDSKFYLDSEKVYIAKDTDKFTLKADSRIVKGVGSFMKSNKPAWEVDKVKELSATSIPGFKLPVQVLKIDGVRMQIHIGRIIRLFLEDGGLEKRDIFKTCIAEFAKKVPVDTVLDARSVIVGKAVEFRVFDILFYKDKDLRDLPLSERMKYLAKIPTTKYLIPVREGTQLITCKTVKELSSAIEGLGDVIVRTLSSGILRKSVHNRGWIEFKSLVEKEWCSDDGGHWVTVRGKHICMGSKVPWKSRFGIAGWTETIHYGPGKSTKFSYTDDVENSFIGDTRATLVNTPDKYVNTLRKVEMSDARIMMKDHFGDKMPEAYKDYADDQVAAYYDQPNKAIIMYKTSDIRSFNHEFGHHIYHSLSDEELNRWRYAWKSEPVVSDYAKVNDSEAFAEAFKYSKQLGGREVMLKQHPKQLEFLDKLLKKD